VIVCCAGPAFAAGLVGGAALAAVRRFTPVAVLLLGLVIVVAGRFALRRHHRATSDPAGVAALLAPRRETLQ
jgi:hypothetical protein